MGKIIGGGGGAALTPALTTWADVTRAAGFDAAAATPNSANLAALVTNETGSGALVFATSPTLVTPALGTPASGVATNLTGTAAGLTSGITQALLSATTTVDVSAATAPTSGQVLQATSGTTATWQTRAAYDASAVAITGGTIVGITDLAVADGGTGASTAAGARTSLGITSADGTQDPRLVVEYFTDCDSDSNAASASGNGSLATYDHSNFGSIAKSYVYDTGLRQGTIDFTTSASATGQGGVGGASSSGDSWFLGNGAITLSASLRIASLSTGTNEFTVSVGLSDTYNFFTRAEYVGLFYDRLNYGVNWQLMTMKTSTISVADTGIVAAAAQFVTLELRVNADATSAQAYINGTAAGAALATNIPLTTKNLLWQVLMARRAGTPPANGVVLDWVYLRKNFSSAR